MHLVRISKYCRVISSLLNLLRKKLHFYFTIKVVLIQVENFEFSSRSTVDVSTLIFTHEYEMFAQRPAIYWPR